MGAIMRRPCGDGHRSEHTVPHASDGVRVTRYGSVVDTRAINRALRQTLWPALREVEFVTRTDRIAWRHEGGHTDLVEVSALGSLADSIGATSVSFGAYVGSVPAWFIGRTVPVRNGLPAPHYWHCELQRTLHKTLSQPWFNPFARPPATTTPRSFLLHREGLQRVLRRDTHDRPDVWFVKDDGSNLDEVMQDLLDVVSSVGLPLLDAFHDPAAVIAMAEGGQLVASPDSPAARDLVDQAQQAL
jgi:hypothetical protein